MRIPGVITGETSDVVEVVSVTVHQTFGQKPGTRGNLEVMKQFFGQYAREITLALELLNIEDHSIVIEHLSDAKQLMLEAAAEVEKQLAEHDRII